jgi:hypothetical protein
MKIFIYKRDEKNHPYATRCFIVEGGVVALGQTYCSDKDRFIKKIGRAKAEGRAKQVLAQYKSGSHPRLVKYKTKNNESFVASAAGLVDSPHPADFIINLLISPYEYELIQKFSKRNEI